jgi:hypothetical protein
VVDVVLQVLAKVIPERVMAGYYGVSSICNLGGYDWLGEGGSVSLRHAVAIRRNGF